MSYLTKAIAVGLLALAAKQYFTKPVQYPTSGFVAKGYEKVQERFNANFKNGLEVEGSAFAVYKDGKLVADLYGGYADREYMRLWQKDTTSIFFSSTKALAAIAIAMLVDRGHLQYTDLVSKHWPEFGKHGKHNVTVAMVMSHQSGVSSTKDIMTAEQVRDRAETSRLLEETPPFWPPGTASGYHAFTIGMLADQICSRVDPAHRNLTAFLDEEVFKPNGVHFGLGYSLADHHRLARLVHVGLWQTVKANAANPTILKSMFEMTIHMIRDSGGLMTKLTESLGYLNGKLDAILLPENADLELSAANGISTARDFAKILSVFADGKLISKKLLNQINQPIRENTIDLVLTVPVSWGYGFYMSKSPSGEWIMGSPGAGGQMIKIDPKRRLAYAYLTNGFGAALVEERFMNLERALYDSLQL